MGWLRPGARRARRGALLLDPVQVPAHRVNQPLSETQNQTSRKETTLPFLLPFDWNCRETSRPVTVHPASDSCSERNSGGRGALADSGVTDCSW
jgi:hypothetical protein